MTHASAAIRDGIPLLTGAAQAVLCLALIFCIGISSTRAAGTGDSTEVTASLEDKTADKAEAPSGQVSIKALRALIETEAHKDNIAPEIVDAVMSVESGYNPDVVGSSGEIGLMQVMPPTARLLGFAGSLSELAVPATNIHYGATYLAEAWRSAGGDLCTTVMKYRAGLGETRFSQRSVAYCLAVRAHLRARGFPVTGTVPVASFGEPGPPLGRLLGRRCHRACLTASGPKLPDLAPLNRQLSKVVWQTKISLGRGL